MKYDRINLLPKGLRKSTFSVGPTEGLLLLFLLEVLLFPILGINQYLNKKNLTMQLDALKAEKESVEINLKSINQIQEVQKTALVKEVVIKNLVNKKNKWSQYFKELSLLLPKDVWLIYFMVEQFADDSEIELSGESPSQTKVSDFYFRLSQSTYYHRVLIKYSEFIDSFTPPLYRFMLSTTTDEERIQKEKDKHKENAAENDKESIQKVNLKMLDSLMPSLGISPLNKAKKI